MTLAVTLTRKIGLRTSVVTDAALILLGSLLVAALAQARIVLPFTPVPITGQTLAVLLIGALLGSKRGAAAIGLYLLEGGLGLPFFSGGGAGWAFLAGPTGGYLLGFIAAAYTVGLLTEHGLDRRVQTALPAFLLGAVIIYAFGMLGLARFVGLQNAFVAGVAPFIIGDALKVVLAGSILPAAWKFVQGFES